MVSVERLRNCLCKGAQGRVQNDAYVRRDGREDPLSLDSLI